ncbi:MAG: hypothetical protein E6H78_21700, partial [Betaproteobacteria bacterium]
MGVDPIVVSVVLSPLFFALGFLLYRIYYLCFEKRGQESLRGLAFFFGILFITEVALVLIFGVDYRLVQTAYSETTLRLGPVDFPMRLVVPFLVSVTMVIGVQLFLTHTFFGRAVLAVAQDQLALRLMGVNPVRVKEFAFALSIATAGVAGAFLIVIQPVQPAIGLFFAIATLALAVVLYTFVVNWDYVGGARGAYILQPRIVPFGLPRYIHLLYSAMVLMTAVALIVARTMSNRVFIAAALIVALVIIAASRLIPNDYVFSAAYTVLQFIVLATAWNILGGYTGYVNFGSPAFFATGAYSTVFLYKALQQPPLIVMIVIGTLAAGMLGLAVGYLTLRMRGVFFAIATLALAVVLYTFVVNWDYVGGARGAYILQPRIVPFGLPRYIHLLYSAMVLMTAVALIVART